MLAEIAALVYHPAPGWLKLQSFTARAPIEPSVVTSPRLISRL
jgi:hypothetical protein